MAFHTVSLDSILVMAMIKAKENHHVAVINLPGAFLKAIYEREVTRKMEDKLDKILEKMEPRIYQKYI